MTSCVDKFRMGLGVPNPYRSPGIGTWKLRRCWCTFGLWWPKGNTRNSSSLQRTKHIRDSNCALDTIGKRISSPCAAATALPNTLARIMQASMNVVSCVTQFTVANGWLIFICRNDLDTMVWNKQLAKCDYGPVAWRPTGVIAVEFLLGVVKSRTGLRWPSLEMSSQCRRDTLRGT